MIHVKTVFDAFTGSKETESTRNLRLQNEDLERKAEEDVREFVRMAEVEKLLNEGVIVPFGTAIESMAATLDARCTPLTPRWPVAQSPTRLRER